MKELKAYEKPTLYIEEMELVDIIAVSNGGAYDQDDSSNSSSLADLFPNI